jgi:hypothetical protein
MFISFLVIRLYLYADLKILHLIFHDPTIYATIPFYITEIIIAISLSYVLYMSSQVEQGQREGLLTPTVGNSSLQTESIDKQRATQSIDPVRKSGTIDGIKNLPRVSGMNGINKSMSTMLNETNGINDSTEFNQNLAAQLISGKAYAFNNGETEKRRVNISGLVDEKMSMALRHSNNQVIQRNPNFVNNNNSNSDRRLVNHVTGNIKGSHQYS